MECHGDASIPCSDAFGMLLSMEPPNDRAKKATSFNGPPGDGHLTLCLKSPPAGR